jgi:hypothetical protein
MINEKNFKGKTQVLVYSGTHDPNMAPVEITNSIYYYKQLNPNGKVICIGHSLGVPNIIQSINNLKNYNIDIDLVVTIDPAIKLKYSENAIIPGNVNKSIGFSSIPKGDAVTIAMSGGISIPENTKKTKVINLVLNNTKHTNIDNTLSKPIIDVLKQYIDSGVNPIESVKKIKKLKIIDNNRE